MKYKEEQHLDFFMETSAKTGQNARNVLIEAAKVLYKDYLKFNESNKEGSSPNPQEKKGQGLIKKDKSKKKGCC